MLVPQSLVFCEIVAGAAPYPGWPLGPAPAPLRYPSRARTGMQRGYSGSCISIQSCSKVCDGMRYVGSGLALFLSLKRAVMQDLVYVLPRIYLLGNWVNTPKERSA
jgi:hypothetical protein